MLTRRHLMRLVATVAAAGPALALNACASGPFLSPIKPSATKITPNGSGLNDEIDFSFALRKRAEVQATLVGADGKTFPIRKPEMRAPDNYQIQFHGVAPVAGSNWLRVVPNGRYEFVVQAQATNGQTIVQKAPIVVADADTTPPRITNLFVSPATFSPNGDGIDDTVQISYRLTKKATVQSYVTDKNNTFYLVDPPKVRNAALWSYTWDGKVSGRVLPDGKYLFHIEATDAAGNFTAVVEPITIANGGTPRLEITDAQFSPTALPLGGDLHVTIKIRNTGTAPLHTLGPAPGTNYTTKMNFSSFRDPKTGTALYYERPGVWRVGVSWQNAPQPYPVRWGFFTDLSRALMPNEEATITGTITVLEDSQPEQVFYASYIQEGVGYGNQVGQQRITISLPPK